NCGQWPSRLVRSLKRPAVHPRARKVFVIEEYRTETAARSDRAFVLGWLSATAHAAVGRTFPGGSIRSGAHRPTACHARRARARPQEPRPRCNPAIFRIRERVTKRGQSQERTASWGPKADDEEWARTDEKCMQQSICDAASNAEPGDP